MSNIKGGRGILKIVRGIWALNRNGRKERKDNGACKIQGGPGGQDQAVEPQHLRDHLQLNPRMLGFTQSTGYAILCIPKSKYNRWTRRHMPKIMKLTDNTSAAALYGEQEEGAHVHQREEREEADPAAFWEDDR
jgi:hypothetical protein